MFENIDWKFIDALVDLIEEFVTIVAKLAITGAAVKYLLS